MSKGQKINVSTFNDDLIGLDEFANRLEKFISVEQEYVDVSLVICLSSKYGSGKSTFLQMWKSSLEGTEGNKPLMVFLNAWESDYYGDPLFAVISALVNSNNNEGESVRNLVNAAKDIGWFATAIGSQIVNKLTGVDPVAAGDFAEKKKADDHQTITDTFSEYEGRKRAMGSLKKAIREFVEESKAGVWFLVDELDRCRPDYAISYLETIKHIFDVKGAVFLLAADRRQLENSAKSAFGVNLDFEEYFRKFIHREITLPPITDSGYKKIALNYVSFYLQKDGIRNCFLELKPERINDIYELVRALRLTPRQIQDVFRIIGHILETSEKNRGKLYWGIGVGSILMSALKIGMPKIYHLLGTQELDPIEALHFLRSLIENDNAAEWWFDLIYTGGGLKISQDDKAEDTYKKVGLVIDGEKFNAQEQLAQLHRGWGNSHRSRIPEIFTKIEQISQWD